MNFALKGKETCKWMQRMQALSLSSSEAQAQSHLWQVDKDKSLARISVSVSVLQAEAEGGDAFCLVPPSLPCQISDKQNCAR